ncbi:MAG: BspA family leucine-rich repeat surface protein [Bacteroidaceae bacterium]|nr:BspA family leucine-rich repeat surface protein [Bacteroidaceae bacterium]
MKTKNFFPQRLLLLVCTLLALVGASEMRAAVSISSSQTFKLHCARGYIYFDGTNLAGTSNASNASTFALIAHTKTLNSGVYYLYDVTKDQIVCHTENPNTTNQYGNYSRESKTDLTYPVYGVFYLDETGNSSYPYMIKDSRNNYLNLDSQNKAGFNKWATSDEGNRFAIEYVGTFNSSTAFYQTATTMLDNFFTYAELSSDQTTLTFRYDNERGTHEGTTTFSLNTGTNDPGWYEYRESITNVLFNPSFSAVKPTSTYRWFSGMSNLTSIQGDFITSEVTNMRSMFYGCSKLTSLNLTGYNTAKVTNMSYMFQNCSSLTSLNVSSFNTANVTDMTAMFDNCSSLTSLDVSGFNTSNCKSLYQMFGGCSKLTSLNVSNFNTGKVTDMRSTFSGCSALTNVDVSGFNTANVTMMAHMFNNCSSLTALDVSGFNTEKVVSMNNMFTNCRNLTALDVSGFNTAKVKNMSYMFDNCSKLTSLDVSKFNTALVTDMHNMFCYCSKVPNLDVSRFNTANVTNMSYMFRGCYLLKLLNVTSFNTALVTNMDYMFANCDSLKTIYASDAWTTEAVTSSNYMFTMSRKLVGGAGTTYNETNPTDATYAHIDGGTANPGYFTVPRNITFADANVKALLTTDYIGIDANGDGEVSEAEAASATADQIQDAFRQDATRAATITSFDEFQYFTGLTEIRNSTFSYCTALKSITLPATITSIDNFAFDGCAALENIVLNEGLTTIGRNAFEDYTGIVTLPSTVTNIDFKAFYNCAGLKVSWTTPPDYNNLLESQQFGPNNADPKKPLYVPIGSYDAYHVAGWWRFDVREYGIIHFADAKVKAICVSKWDTNGDGELGAEEAEVVQSWDFYSVFQENTDITSFDELKYFIGMTYIPESAFNTCTNLSSITLPRTITEVKGWALFGCTSLTSIDIPEGVKAIGQSAFYGCSSLTEIGLYYGLETIGEEAFTKTALERFTIPGSVTNMDDAFQAQTTVIPQYVTAPWWEPIAITENTFPKRAQATLFVPEGKEEVYRSAPYWQDFGTIVSKIEFNDPAVKAICIANFDSNGDGELTLDEAAAVTTLGTAFKGNTEIQSFNELQYFTGLDDGSEWHNHILTGEAFQGCTNLVAVTLPPNITRIYNRAFEGCSSLQYVYGMPDAVTLLGDATFSGCTSLQSLNLPTSIRMINYRLFYGCSSLRSVTIPEGVTYYGDEAFAGCTALTQVTVKNPTPATGSNINGDPFPTRANINLIVPPHTLEAYSTTDYWKDFKNFKELEPDWLQYTDENGDIYQYEPGYSAQLYRYADKNGRTTFVMPESITVDGVVYPVTAIAGLHSSYLQSLTIPASVTALKDNAFSCTPVPGSGFSLQDIYMRSSQPPTAGSQTDWITSIVSFNHLMQAQYPNDPSKQVSLKNITLHVPAGSLAAYQAATFWKEFTVVEYSVPATEAYALLSTDGKTLTFYYDCEKANRQGTAYALNSGNSVPEWAKGGVQSNIETAVFDPSFSNARPTSTAYWFHQMGKLTAINGMENLNTSEVTRMNNMFYNLQKLETLDLTHFNTAKVTSMSYMFETCSKLTSLDLSSFNTENVTLMDRMFESCNSLSSLDLSNFNTENVKDMLSMFSGCSSLTSLDLSSFNTANVIDMRYMFTNCQGLKVIDLSSFNTAKVKYTYKMFRNCSNLTTIYAGSGWTMDAVDTSKANNYDEMFFDDAKLIGHAGTAYDSNEYTAADYHDIVKARIDGGTSAPGYFSLKPYAHLSADGKTLTFYNDGKSKEKVGHIYDVLKYGYSGWYADGSAANITDVVFDPSFADARPTTTAFWFYNMPYLTTITGLEYLNTSEVTTMRAMFYNCQNLTSLNLSSFNTDNVTNMSYMFASCYNLRSLDLSSFNTDNVTNMQSMFASCADLRSLDLSRFNTAQVTNMSNMFLFCSSLTSLDISSFNTAAVKNMTQMFGGCSELTTIYAGDGWTTAALESDGKQRLFLYDTKLVGGAGTTYDESAYIVTSEDNGGVDTQYARIDGGTSAPGYFTREGAPMHGDVNGDGVVTIADVTSLVNIILGKSPAPATGVADVNTDGSVTIADVTALVNKILGK